MLELVPRYLERLDPTRDRTRRMFETLGINAEALAWHRGLTVVVRLDPGADAARSLATAALVDLLVRLQPVVGSVVLDCTRADAMARDLQDRFPLEIRDVSNGAAAALAVSVGGASDSCDLLVDGAGWCLAVGETCPVEDDGNPVGPMAMGAVGAAEVFKLLFRTAHPDEPLSRRFVPHRGPFSLWNWSASWTSPALPETMWIDAVLVGAGGVGAGVITTLAPLGDRLQGRLNVVDDDRLDLYNLNRVTYARVEEADRGDEKVSSARAYLARRLGRLDVGAVPEVYRAFARRIARRKDRRYPLVMTGVDDDAIRYEVQRDLPRVLIDGATGSQGNLRLDRVGFGVSGCLGCARPPRPRPRRPEECDAPPAPHAPSISFLSALAGVLVAGEAIRVAAGIDTDGHYVEWTFTYPMNPELGGQVQFHPACPVACRDPLVLEAFRKKWAGGEADAGIAAVS